MRAEHVTPELWAGLNVAATLVAVAVIAVTVWATPRLPLLGNAAWAFAEWNYRRRRRLRRLLCRMTDGRK